MNTQQRKKLLLKFKEYRCQLCSNEGNWLGTSLSLQIDHIDGNSSNDSISNLRFLCPNCHSQTHNYAGRNAKKKVFNRPSKEEFNSLYAQYTLKEMSLIRAVSLRTVYQWFKFFTYKEPESRRKLTCSQVNEIKASKSSERKIAAKFNVSRGTIVNVKSNSTYKDCN